MFGELDVLLVVPELLAGGDADLLFHDVDARDFLGDGMLDLDAGIHLDEVERAGRIEQEFDGAGIDVIHRRGRLDGGLAHPFAQVAGERR